jgi:LacI family transcriptional regulator
VVRKIAVTLKQIAELAGVSRGTVDRALYDRGRVNPEVANNIKRIAEEMGYQPNRAGRALALSKNPIKIGVIIQSCNTPFMLDIIEGVNTAINEVERLGGKVILRQIYSVNPYETIEYMEELRLLNVTAIALVPTTDSIIRDKINQFTEIYSIPIITINSDVEDSKRMCFVGQNALQGGRTAGGLMGEILNGTGTISILSGHTNNASNTQRILGFKETLSKHFPELEILPQLAAYDDNEAARNLLLEQLRQHPDINGLFISASGIRGSCQALTELNLTQSVKVICFDVIEENISYLKQGIINFLIGQDAFYQGYHPIMILFQYFFENKKVEKEFLYTDIVIKTKYNI